VAVSTLAIGIGANTAVFSVVNSILLKPLSYPRADELVALRLTAPGAPGLTDGLRLSPSMYRTFADHNRVFQSLGVWIATRGTVTEVGEPEDVRALGISDGLLETFNVPPAAERLHGVHHCDAQLRVLAAALRRRSLRRRTHADGGRAPEEGRRRDARGIPHRQRRRGAD